MVCREVNIEPLSTPVRINPMFIRRVVRMSRVIFIFLTCLVVNEIEAQTGPAGVGSSTNNVLWLKADAGITSATDGTAVPSWRDQSGNAIHVGQSNTNQQPVYRSSVMNGFPAIEFDNTNTSGQNDFLTAPDNSLLDNTNGYSFFTVTRMKNLDGGTARSIVCKRTSIDTDEAFMIFYYSSNYMYVDIDGLGDRFSTSPTTYANNTNYIIDVVYDGTLAAASRTKVYEQEILRKTANETSALVPDKNSPLLLGATHASDNRAFGGYMSEVIIYRTALNDASRVIVNNYLSAKYNIALTTNDKYLGDNAANGDYDREVAGIGMESSGSNNAFASSVSGGVALAANSGLDATDYLLAGHASPSNSEITTDVGGMSGTNNARWQRIWYVDVTNTGASINTNMEFNTTDGGIASPTAVALSDYVLLYRTAQTGNWTEVTTASAITGNRILFNAIDLTTDGYYTLGLKNYPNTPLPVALVSFTANLNSGKVNLNWTTATEIDNNFFTVQRSNDGINYETVATIKGAGNSNTVLQYGAVDNNPYSGVSYYKLMQTDFDGKQTYFGPVTINNSQNEESVNVYPNPVSSSDPVFYLSIPEGDEEVSVVVRDIQGREFYSRVIANGQRHELIAISPAQPLAAGMYIAVVSSSHYSYSQKFIVR